MPPPLEVYMTQYKYGKKERFFIEWGTNIIGIDGYLVLDFETEAGTIIVFRRPVMVGRYTKRYLGKQGSRWAAATESGDYIPTPNMSGRAAHAKSRDQQVSWVKLFLRTKSGKKWLKKL